MATHASAKKCPSVSFRRRRVAVAARRAEFAGRSGPECLRCRGVGIHCNFGRRICSVDDRSPDANLRGGRTSADKSCGHPWSRAFDSDPEHFRIFDTSSSRAGLWLRLLHCPNTIARSESSQCGVGAVAWQPRVWRSRFRIDRPRRGHGCLYQCLHVLGERCAARKLECTTRRRGDQKLGHAAGRRRDWYRHGEG